MTSMNRRANLAGTASAAVASPAIAFPIAPHPDAELLALGERLRSAQIALRAASNRAEAGGAAYTARRAPMPDACRPKPGDNEGLGVDKAEWPDGFYAAHQVDRLRDLQADRPGFEVVDNPDGFTVRKFRRSNDLVRAQEIIKAFKWKAADAAL